jgi:hypothetical protein
MSQHLSSQRISAWMAGERLPEDEQHVRECPQCAAELARFETTLARFHDSVRDWSGRQPGSEPGNVPLAAAARNPFRTRPARWAIAAAVLLLAASVSIERSMRRPQPSQDMVRADALLLEQVDAAVSRAVPRTMEPLLGPMATNTTSSDSTNDATGKDNHETTQQK